MLFRNLIISFGQEVKVPCKQRCSFAHITGKHWLIMITAAHSGYGGVCSKFVLRKPILFAKIRAEFSRPLCPSVGFRRKYRTQQNRFVGRNRIIATGQFFYIFALIRSVGFCGLYIVLFI